MKCDLKLKIQTRIEEDKGLPQIWMKMKSGGFYGLQCCGKRTNPLAMLLCLILIWVLPLCNIMFIHDVFLFFNM